MSRAQRCCEDSNGRKMLPLWGPEAQKRGRSYQNVEALKEEPWSSTGPQRGNIVQLESLRDHSAAGSGNEERLQTASCCCHQDELPLLGWRCISGWGGSGGEVTARTGIKTERSTSHFPVAIFPSLSSASERLDSTRHQLLRAHWIAVCRVPALELRDSIWITNPAFPWCCILQCTLTTYCHLFYYT